MLNWFIKKLAKAAAVDILENNGSFITQMGNGHITVNGKKYQGNNVSVVDNRIYIDGVLQND